MGTSSIEWTDRVWNPTVGCTKVSAGCKHCYAETMHARLTRMGEKKYADPFRVVKPWTAHLAEPLKWKKPARIFVNSMSDLFHEDVPDEYIAAVFGVMAAAHWHTFQVLTKRADRMARWFEWVGMDRGCGVDKFVQDCAHSRVERFPLHSITGTLRKYPWALPNVWLGISVENQEQAEARIPHLLRVPAAVRFMSVEPLLGPVDLTPYLVDDLHRMGRAPRMEIDWVIVGGESGHGARPYDLAWSRSIIAQCRAADVPVFHKQLGAAPESTSDDDRRHIGDMNPPARFLLLLRDRKGGDMAEWPDDLRVRQFPPVRP